MVQTGRDPAQASIHRRIEDLGSHSPRSGSRGPGRAGGRMPAPSSPKERRLAPRSPSNHADSAHSDLTRRAGSTSATALATVLLSASQCGRAIQSDSDRDRAARSGRSAQGESLSSLGCHPPRVGDRRCPATVCASSAPSHSVIGYRRHGTRYPPDLCSSDCHVAAGTGVPEQDDLSQSGPGG